MNTFPLPEFVFAMVPSFIEENDPTADLLREYAGRVVFRHQKGNLIFENGVFVSIEGSPDNVIFYNNQKPHYAIWLDDEGQIHRQEGPAIVMYDDNYNTIMELWVIHGTFPIFEDDSPQIICYDNGRIYQHTWCAQTPITVNDLQSNNFIWAFIRQHHDIHPAIIRYYADGSILVKYWFILGAIHNNEVGAPAHIAYRKNGEVAIEGWYHHGVMHRDGNLPALIEYGRNGNISRVLFYTGGQISQEILNEDGSGPEL
jgi:hypothetical protein